MIDIEQWCRATLQELSHAALDRQRWVVDDDDDDDNGNGGRSGKNAIGGIRWPIPENPL